MDQTALLRCYKSIKDDLDYRYCKTIGERVTCNAQVYDSAGLKPQKGNYLISFTQPKGGIQVVERPNKTITVKQSLDDLQADWLVRVLVKQLADWWDLKLVGL